MYKTELIQYVLSAFQRRQGFSIWDTEEGFIELHHKGERFYCCNAFVQVKVIYDEIEKYQREFCLEVG
jgi:hypothetical protein